MKHHMTKNGPRPCEAEVKDCPYGEHFDTQQEAEEVFQQRMSQKYGSASTIASKPRRYVPALGDASDKTLKFFANNSPAGYARVDDVLQDRLRATRELPESLSQSFHPDNKKRIEAMRNKNAQIIEIMQNSPHAPKPAYKDENLSKIGPLIETTRHDPNTQEWLDIRETTLGGSDVGAIAENDFLTGRDRKKWVTERFEEIQDVKTGRTQLAAEEEERAGAIYRGNVWEDRIRDEFAREHPELNVVNAKGQYVNPDNPMSQMNFDGVICDGEGKPTGILEIKTGSYAPAWEDGVPLGYRAQTLYYLENTGLDKAYVRAKINDTEDFTYVIHRGDPVNDKDESSPTMREYIDNRLTPLFQSWTKERKERKMS